MDRTVSRIRERRYALLAATFAVGAFLAFTAASSAMHPCSIDGTIDCSHGDVLDEEAACPSPEDLQSEAAKLCDGHCNAETGKCGVNGQTTEGCWMHVECYDGTAFDIGAKMMEGGETDEGADGGTEDHCGRVYRECEGTREPPRCVEEKAPECMDTDEWDAMEEEFEEGDEAEDVDESSWGDSGCSGDVIRACKVRCEHSSIDGCVESCVGHQDCVSAESAGEPLPASSCMPYGATVEGVRHELGPDASPSAILEEAHRRQEEVLADAREQGFQGSLADMESLASCPEGSTMEEGMHEEWEGGLYEFHPEEGSPMGEGMHGPGPGFGVSELTAVLTRAVGMLVELSQRELPADQKAQVSEALGVVSAALQELASGGDLGAIVLRVKEKLEGVMTSVGGGFMPDPARAREEIERVLKNMHGMLDVAIPKAFDLMPTLFAEHGVTVVFDDAWKSVLEELRAAFTEVEAVCQAAMGDGGDVGSCFHAVEGFVPQMEKLKMVAEGTIEAAMEESGEGSEMTMEQVMRQIEQQVFSEYDMGPRGEGHGPGMGPSGGMGPMGMMEECMKKGIPEEECMQMMPMHGMPDEMMHQGKMGKWEEGGMHPGMMGPPGTHDMPYWNCEEIETEEERSKCFESHRWESGGGGGMEWEDGRMREMMKAKEECIAMGETEDERQGCMRKVMENSGMQGPRNPEMEQFLRERCGEDKDCMEGMYEKMNAKFGPPRPWEQPHSKFPSHQMEQGMDPMQYCLEKSGKSKEECETRPWESQKSY